MSGVPEVHGFTHRRHCHTPRHVWELRYIWGRRCETKALPCSSAGGRNMALECLMNIFFCLTFRHCPNPCQRSFLLRTDVSFQLRLSSLHTFCADFMDLSEKSVSTEGVFYSPVFLALVEVSCSLGGQKQEFEPCHPL